MLRVVYVLTIFVFCFFPFWVGLGVNDWGKTVDSWVYEAGR